MKLTPINAPSKGKPGETAASDIEQSDQSRKRSKEADVSDRRNFMKVAGAGLVAASVPSIASAAMARTQTKEEDVSASRSNSVFMYGCGWNRTLPGVFGEVCLCFDARAELGGTGVGTFHDDVHPEVNSQFQINSATRQGNEVTFEGVIIASRSRQLIGMQVRIVAESLGDGRGSSTITVESGETNLVVLGIICVLMFLLMPAVQ